ncbi:MAG: carbohydrate ABC transporter substrate-binding protein, partial [Okeania sp. SIO2H7]|nr:carbohydrate ABC transporter substrate-binding protein [Okeania sp. SIO2H7]
DTLIPSWIWNGQLADVSDVVEPLQDTLRASALQSVQHYDNVAQQRSIYAVPISQQAVYIHYWRDMLTEAGLDEADIPTEWDAFWDFWKMAQDNLRAQGKSDLYAMGLSMSPNASDTFKTLYQMLEAYDVDLLDDEGKLQVDTPQMRQKIAIALEWYTSFYMDGYVPEVATTWSDSGNNGAFLNREVLMTINPTLSIPGSQREDDPDAYSEKIATIAFPNEPDGDAPTYFVRTNKAVIFKDSVNQDLAKEFLAFLMQSENLAPYLEGAQGRYFPILNDMANDPFWNDPADPHIFVGNQDYMQSNTRAIYHDVNGTYSQVNLNNVWGQAINSIVSDGTSPQDAADQVVDQIVQIFNDREP